ncbi:hypothetical protein C5Y97_28100 [Blastopirellula marina]|uniref:PsbP C-terminal domain-containing protein n=2 Tax=Blastopirellula marina TaxID=124 RepID=A0A2S8F4L8_9BACT|nr:hypothetical protein C5Y98_28085 [Blastopirellula marina]PTL41259.1 hypothetical protein C5Y97_28100 [Blastopirellula marina]
MTLRTNLIACALLSLVLGCSTESPTKPSGDSAVEEQAVASPESKKPAVSLAPAGDPTPPLDQGRVQSTMPKGWKFLPRSNDYLFAAYHQDKGGVPRLVLRQIEAGDLPTTDSAETAKPLATAIGKEFPSGGISPLSVLNVGENWYVRFEKKMSFRSEPATGVFLVTVQGGKRFTLELLTYANKKDDFLPALYRFAGDLKIEAAEPVANEAASGEESPESEADSSSS